MYDDAASFNPERFTWVFNAEGKDTFKGSGSTVQIVRPKAGLRMEILTPEKLTRTVKPHPDRDGSLIMLTTPAPSKAEKFLAVLIPSREDNRAEREAWKISRITKDGWTGAVVNMDSTLEQVLFRITPGNGIISAGEWETDGDRMAIFSDIKRGVYSLYVREAMSLKKAGEAVEMIMRSTERVSINLVYINRERNFILGSADSKTASTLSLKVGWKPERILLNGAVSKYEYDSKTGMTTLNLKAGTNGIWIQQ